MSESVRSFPFGMSKHTVKKPTVDPDFTLRRVFGKANFRYPLTFTSPALLPFFDRTSDHISVILSQRH